MRTFIHYDADGEIIAVLQTESLAEGVAQPFYLEDEKHGAAEVTDDDALSEHAAAELSASFRYDKARRKLVGKSAPKAAAKKAGAKKGRRTAGAK